MLNEIEKTKTENAELWQAFFDEQRGELTLAARVLLRNRSSAETVLSQALEVLRDATPNETHRHAYAMRAIVKSAIAHNLKNMTPDKVVEISSYMREEDGGMLRIGALPWPERAVYFLRDILRYSRRDTALLLKLSDSNVDQLLGFAQRRVGQSRSVHQSGLKRWAFDLSQASHL